MRIEEKIIRSADFPKQLLVSRSKPDMLWYLGDLELLKMPMVSVVGRRKVSKEGIARTQRVTKTLVSQGICVVSGLAEGVDAAAHTTALREHGATVAVMGTPIDECYPATHAQLKTDIKIHGLVLSQFEPGSEIQKGNFPRRNELMASLSIMTIVVEADINSGTRHQVKSAIALGRTVGFLPSLAESHFPWVEDALKSGRGFVINSPRDLIKQLEMLRGNKDQAVSLIKEDQLTLAVEHPLSKPVEIVTPLAKIEKEPAPTVVTVSKDQPTPVIDVVVQPKKSLRASNWFTPIIKCWSWITSHFKKNSDQ